VCSDDETARKLKKVACEFYTLSRVDRKLAQKDKKKDNSKLKLEFTKMRRMPIGFGCAQSL